MSCRYVLPQSHHPAHCTPIPRAMLAMLWLLYRYQVMGSVGYFTAQSPSALSLPELRKPDIIVGKWRRVPVRATGASLTLSPSRTPPSRPLRWRAPTTRTTPRRTPSRTAPRRTPSRPRSRPWLQRQHQPWLQHRPTSRPSRRACLPPTTETNKLPTRPSQRCSEPWI